MKFARIGAAGAEVPVVVTDDGYLDLTGITADIDGAFLSGGGVERAAEAVAGGSLPKLSNAIGDRLGSPITRPSAIICVGMNYAAHAAESGSAPPEVPIIFLKTPNTMVGPNDEVLIPRGSEKTDWEVELGVVIKDHVSYLDRPEDAIGHVAGFLIGNDLSEREWQIEKSGGQWSKGKSAPGFSPLGPWLVTPDEVDHQDLNLRSFVNGEPRQDSNTKDLIFGVEFIIFQLSQYLAFEPGDVILTGTPEGVALSGRFPYLKPGDVVELEIDGLGRQRQTFGSAR